MQSNRNNNSAAAATRPASKSKNALLPPRPPKKANRSLSDVHADAADARRAQRAELLSKLKKKQESVSRKHKHSTSSIASSTEGSATIVTRARAKQHDAKRAKQDTSGSYAEMSPTAFHDYRASIGHIRLPVNEVNIGTLKSPTSTLGGMSFVGSESLLSPVQPETTSAETETSSSVQLVGVVAGSAAADEVVSGSVADNASIGASSTESALLELFKPTKKVPSSKKKRTKERTQPSVSILREMRRAAAFDALTFVFTQFDNMSKEGREAAIYDHFHGTTSQLNNDDSRSIQGTINQLISGHSAYVALYDEGDTIGTQKELILKTRYCGRMESASRYVADMHFTAKLISEYGLKKSSKVSGRSLWDLAKETLLNLKKAMALVKKLDNIVVILDDKSHRAIDYMSGKNEDSFFTAVVNGMWQLKQSKLEKKRKSNDTGKFYSSYC